MPLRVVTTTSTRPLACAGVVQVAERPFPATMQDEVVPPKLKSPPVRFVPVMVTVVPPAAGPTLGETPVMVGVGGRDVYVKLLGKKAEPLVFVTAMSTVPSACAGVTKVMVVSLTIVKDPDRNVVVPMVTAVAVVKLVPVIVTVVPPTPGPVLGLTPDMEGAVVPIGAIGPNSST